MASKILIFALCAIIPCAQLTNTKCLLADTACLTQQLSVGWKDFVKGIPELGIDPLDEMALTLKKECGDLNFNFCNMVVTGLGDAVIDKYSIDTDFNVVRLLLHTSLCFNTGYFTIEGSLFSLPLNATGSGSVSVDNIYIDLLFPFEIIKNDAGKDIISLKKYNYGFQIIGDVQFNGNYQEKQLEDSKINLFMNDAWRIVTNSYGIYFYDGVANKIYEALQIYLKSTPITDLAIYVDNC